MSITVKKKTPKTPKNLTSKPGMIICVWIYLSVDTARYHFTSSDRYEEALRTYRVPAWLSKQLNV